MKKRITLNKGPKLKATEQGKKHVKKAITNAVEITDGGWLEPDLSLLSDAKMPAPTLPLELFHPRWQKCMEITSEVKGCPIDFVALPMMVAVASTLGNGRRIEAWKGFNQPGILWGMIIGNPSSGKSPGMASVTEMLTKIQNELDADYKEKLSAWLKEKEVADIHFKNWRINAKRAVKEGEPVLSRPKESEEPPKPPRPRFVIVDSTIEEARNILSVNPRGILMIRDELSGFIRNLTRYNGSDKEFYLPAYDGGYYSADRVRNENPIIIPSLSISLLGGIRPEKFDEDLRSTADDGFVARFLMTWPDYSMKPRPTCKPDDQFIYEVLKRLRELPVGVGDDGEMQSIYLKLTDEARDCFDAWRVKGEEREKSASGLLLSFVGKMPGMALRIALVLLYMDWAANHDRPEPKKVRPEHMARAITLLEDYFMPMAKRVLADTGLPQDERDARTVARWMQEHQPDLMNAKEFRRMRGSPIRDSRRVKAAFQFLVESNWLCYIGGREGEKKMGGRERSDYAINPLLKLK